MNRKILIIIIILLIIVLTVSGIFLYLNHSKEETGKNIEDEDMSQGAEISPKENPEEVIEEIKAFHTSSSTTTVSFVKEEDECWYFSDSDGYSYTYCFANPEILKMEK